MNINATPTTPAEVRQHLIDALQLDLIGPIPDDEAHAAEIINQPPSRWYLSGFLVPWFAKIRGIRSDENGECFHSIDFSKQTDRNFAVISQYFALKPPQFPPAFGAKPPVTPQVGQPQLAPTLEVRAFSNSRLPT